MKICFGGHTHWHIRCYSVSPNQLQSLPVAAERRRINETFQQKEIKKKSFWVGHRYESGNEPFELKGAPGSVCCGHFVRQGRMINSQFPPSVVTLLIWALKAIFKVESLTLVRRATEHLFQQRTWERKTKTVASSKNKEAGNFFQKVAPKYYQAMSLHV